MSPWIWNPSRFSELHPPNGSEGFEFMVSAPEVLLRKNPDTGKTEEPFEDRANLFEAQHFKFQTRFFFAGGGGWTRKGELCHVNDSFFGCNQKWHEIHFHGGCFPLQDWFCFVKLSYECEGGGLDRLEDGKSPFPEKRNSTLQTTSNWAMKKPLDV